MKMRAAFIVLVMLGLTHSATAQGKFNLRIGASFPYGDFAEDDLNDQDAGGAATGLNVGMSYSHPFSENGFSLLWGIDLNYNSLKGDVKDELVEIYQAQGIFPKDIEYWHYINVPISFGVNYSNEGTNGIGLFLDAGIVLNLLKVSDYEVTVDYETVKIEYFVGQKVGFKVGGGVLIGERYSVGIHFLDLGEHELDGVLSSNVTGYTEENEFTQTVKMFTMTVGVQL